MKITLLYQVSHYIRVKKHRNIKSWDQENYFVISGFCYIRPLYNEVPLYYVYMYVLVYLGDLLVELDLVIKSSDITKKNLLITSSLFYTSWI